MLIDWFTVAAQLVNFLVLVWLLKRFLYKPILKAIDEREHRVAMQLQEAEAKKAEAYREFDDFQRKNSEFDLQREGLMSIAVSEVKAERQRLLDEARREVADLRLKLHETLRSEHQSLNQEIIRRTRSEVFAITRRVLADLASADLEAHMADVFIRRLKALNEEEKRSLLSALSTSPKSLAICSAFDLPKAQQASIQQTIKEAFSSEAQVTFETSANLIGGIELVASGYKVSWNIEEYLASLEESLSKLLKETSE